jgi:hypothetical protein
MKILKITLLVLSLSIVAICISAPMALHYYGLHFVDRLPEPPTAPEEVSPVLQETWVYWGGKIPIRLERISPMRYWGSLIIEFIYDRPRIIPDSPEGFRPASHVARIHIASELRGFKRQMAEAALAIHILNNWSAGQIATYLKDKAAPNKGLKSDAKPRGTVSGVPLQSL